MENLQNAKNKNRWKIPAIILMIIVAILIGTTSMFAVLNLQKKMELNNIKSQSSQNNSSNGIVAIDSTPPREFMFSSLIVPEFGLRVYIPHEISDIAYEIQEIDGVQYANFTGTFNAISDNSLDAPFYSGEFGYIARAQGCA